MCSRQNFVEVLPLFLSGGAFEALEVFPIPVRLSFIQAKSRVGDRVAFGFWGCEFYRSIRTSQFPAMLVNGDFVFFCSNADRSNLGNILDEFSKDGQHGFMFLIDSLLIIPSNESQCLMNSCASAGLQKTSPWDRSATFSFDIELLSCLHFSF